MKKIIFSIFLMIVMIYSNLYSQKQEAQNDTLNSFDLSKMGPLNIFMGVSFSNAIPQDEFQSSLLKSGVTTGQGISGTFGYLFKTIPVMVGLNFDILDWKKYEKIISYNSSPFVKDTITVTNKSYPINLFIRYEQLVFSWLVPYVDGFAGLTFYNSNLDYKSNTYPKSSNSLGGISFNYGIGLGTKIKIIDKMLDTDSHNSLFLDFKIRYSLGTDTDFQIMKIDGNKVVNDKFKSKTNTIISSIGLFFQL